MSTHERVLRWPVPSGDWRADTRQREHLADLLYSRCIAAMRAQGA